ncbi:MAG TPA: VRR-NUC domain-containing protein [Acidiphilium sp.]
MKHGESIFHSVVAEWLGLCLIPPAWWTTIPGGHAKLPIRVAARIKRLGYKAGTPDLVVAWPGKVLWIELKGAKTAIAPHQKAQHELLRAAGCEVAICRTVEAVEAELVRLGAPLRGHRRTLQAPDRPKLVSLVEVIRPQPRDPSGDSIRPVDRRRGRRGPRFKQGGRDGYPLDLDPGDNGGG